LGVFALHLLGAAQEFPAKSKLRILFQQGAGAAFRFGVTSRVIQREQRIHFTRRRLGLLHRVVRSGVHVRWVILIIGRYFSNIEFILTMIVR
jgi:hypothetical protein